MLRRERERPVGSVTAAQPRGKALVRSGRQDHVAASRT
jgi:hypothetical protein